MLVTGIVSSNTLVFLLIASGTVIGLAGTDLVLPAIPTLPAVLGGSVETAQWVLAAFAGGTGLGLLVYGGLGTRYRMGDLLVFSLAAFAILSFSATFASTIPELSVIRFFQGFVAAAPAVYAPVMIKSLYDDQSAIAMLGRIGSIESMTPALAPLLGVWLLGQFGWKSTFYLTGVVAVAISTVWWLRRDIRMRFGFSKPLSGGYRSLLQNNDFMRYALSQAFTLGALLIIVFAAPTIITHTFSGELSDFVVLQVIGISCFVASANLSHAIAARFGSDRTILTGSAISAAGCIGILCVGLLSSYTIEYLWFLFVFVNLGLGIRGPTGFYRALQAAGANESRGSALVVFLILTTAALGTAAVAPFIRDGLVPLGVLASSVSMLAVRLSCRGASRRARPL